MLEKNGEKWGDKVRILGISIDQTAEAVVSHVETKGWKSVEHFHKASSNSDETYGVQGVPHVVLIDTKGVIVYIGHPASRDLEADINTLLKGEPLKGKGEKSEEKKEESASSTNNDAKITSDLVELDGKLKELMETSETKEAVKSLT